jgi:YYY domain-containing protein
MIAFISWYIVITLLGWLTFPLAYHLFPALQDRGYAFSRTFGLLIWGYVFWLFASLGIAQNDVGGLLLALLVLVGLSTWAFYKDHGPWTTDHAMVDHQWSIVEWLRSNARLILTTESLFLLAFALMAWIRANNPEIYTSGGEKWMETAFINAILHSPTFPPHDPWLSGYAISYYYFGYVMAAMLAKLTSTVAPVAHNLMLSLIFALSAVGAYGLLYNLVSAYRRSKGEEEKSARGLAVSGALLGPLFLLVVSNLEAVFESLRSKGIGWTFAADGTAIPSSFWSWIDLQVISKTPPALPLKWAPTEFFWWWRASRVIMDYDLTGRWMGDIIDEFPFFSYLLGDLHPHVLAMPFNLLALAVALNIFLGGWKGHINLFFGELRISKVGFFIVAFVLGGLAFLNTWDILLGAALIVLSYALAQVRESGWDWERIADVMLVGIPAGMCAFLLYLPFFVSFDSQAKGLLPNFMFVTRPVHLWIMWGTLFIPILAYLIYLWRGRISANWRVGIFTSLSIVLVLIVMMFVIGFIGLKIKPHDVQAVLDSQGRTIGQFISDGMAGRVKKLGSLLTLLALLVPALAFLFRRSGSSEEEFSREQPSVISPMPFVFLLMTLGFLLILGPEFVYLRDNFSYRINTVFKFYYQAWILLSLIAAFTVVVMLSELRGVPATVYSVVIAIVIGLGLVYPMFSIPSKTDNFKTSNIQNDPDQIKQRTLDGSAYLARSMPDDYKAFQFMQTLEPGVVAEAVGGQYSEYARVATFTGMPDVLGWPGHEGQWRDNSLQGSRQNDIQTLYTTSDWSTAQEIIQKYNIRYVYIGNLERSTYPVNEEKFTLFLKKIYLLPKQNENGQTQEQSSVTIYEVPQVSLETEP